MAIRLPLTPDSFRGADIRVIAVDMDGTLLNEKHALSERSRRALVAARDAGIRVVPASGRQWATLHSMFEPILGESVIVLAENGTVLREGRSPIATHSLPAHIAPKAVDLGRRVPNGGVVVCTPEVAYIENSAPEFRSEVDKYYASVEVVEDLHSVDGTVGTAEVVKVAVFAFGSSERDAEPILGPLREEGVDAVVSAAHWLDVMPRGVHKGRALEELTIALDLERDQVMAFGDYLNDLEMLEAAGWSFAMNNAHPDVAAAARYEAPSNAEDGVAQVIEALLAAR